MARFEHIGLEKFDLKKGVGSNQHPVTYSPIDSEDLDKIEKGFLDKIHFKNPEMVRFWFRSQ